MIYAENDAHQQGQGAADDQERDLGAGKSAAEAISILDHAVDGMRHQYHSKRGHYLKAAVSFVYGLYGR